MHGGGKTAPRFDLGALVLGRIPGEMRAHDVIRGHCTGIREWADVIGVAISHDVVGLTRSPLERIGVGLGTFRGVMGGDGALGHSAVLAILVRGVFPLRAVRVVRVGPAWSSTRHPVGTAGTAGTAGLPRILGT